MYEHLVNLCVKYMRNFVENVEHAPQKSSKLIWLALPDMVRYKSFLTPKIRIGTFLVIIQYSLVVDLPVYAENCLPHIHYRCEAG